MRDDLIRLKRCCGPEHVGLRGGGNLRFCIGSECAAWRETKAGAAAYRDDDNNPIAAIPAEGFCGLAGAEP